MGEYLDNKSFVVFDDLVWDLKQNPKSPDAFGIIIGGTGKGKSNVAQAIAYDVDEKFSDERIIFQRIEWDLLKSKMKRGEAVIFDEGIDFFFSRNAMTTDTKEMVQEMAKIRSMGFLMLVCIPSLRLLDWYVKGERPHFIIKVNSPYFKLWSFMDNKEQTEEEAEIKLQIILKQGLNSVKPDWKGRWKPVEGVKWDKYESKKRSHQIGMKKSKKILKAQLKAQKALKDSWTMRDIATEKSVIPGTCHKYVDMFVPKKYVFSDMSGVKRITMQGKQILDKKWAKEIEKRERKKRRKKRR